MVGPSFIFLFLAKPHSLRWNLMARHGGREGQETGVEVGSPRESEEGMEGKGKNPAEEQAVTKMDSRQALL